MEAELWTGGGEGCNDIGDDRHYAPAEASKRARTDSFPSALGFHPNSNDIMPDATTSALYMFKRTTAARPFSSDEA